MKLDNKINLHHYGFLTDDSKKAIKNYKFLGYEINQSFLDNLRGVKITFLKHSSTDVLLEIIEPFDNNSDVSNIMKKYKNNLYHSCFEVTNIKECITKLEKAGFITIDLPKPAIAFNNRKVAFLLSKYTGIIELLER